jgi:hypothetical protein
VPLFLYESLIMFPGKSGEYCTTFAEKYLPLNDDYDSKWLRLSGFFTPDVLYSTQPRIAILWTIPDWEAWGGRMAGSTAEERLRKVQEFMQPAMSQRSGWTDKLLEPLDFSPLPVVRPDSSKPGATVIDHQFLVRPEHCAEFVKVFKDEVLPAAEASGVTLELIGRVAGRPSEYIAIWSVPNRAAHASWRASRSPNEPAYGLPGFERAWPLLTDLIERELTPTWFSPLGGTQQAEKHLSEEHASI